MRDGGRKDLIGTYEFGTVDVSHDEYGDITIWEIILDNYPIHFNVDWVKDKKQMEWLDYVIGHNLTEVRDRAFKLGQESVRKPIREALSFL